MRNYLHVPRPFQVAVALIVSVAVVVLSRCHQVHGLAASSQLQHDGPVDARDNGWKQLVTLLSPDATNPNSSSWLDWSTKCSLAAGIVAAPEGDKQIALSPQCGVAIQTQLPPVVQHAETSLQSPPGVHIGSVLFNAKATEFILGNHLSLPPQGSPDSLTPKRGQILSVKPFPTDSMVVKAIWELVSLDREGTNQYWPLRVYDSGNVMAMVGSVNQLLPIVGGGGHPGWSTEVYLDVQSNRPCPFDGGTPTDIGLNPTPTLPLACFVSYPISSKNAAQYLVATAGKQMCLGTCYLVLVGLHIAHKDAEKWSWTTFWWTNHPSADPAHFEGQARNLAALPAQVASQYKHFAMETTYANPQVIFNPYQEGPEGPNGTVSNCAGCHRTAAVRSQPTSTDPKGLGSAEPSIGLTLPAIAGKISPTPGEYATDSVWSLATARSGGDVLFVQPIKRKLTIGNVPQAR